MSIYAWYLFNGLPLVIVSAKDLRTAQINAYNGLVEYFCGDDLEKLVIFIYENDPIITKINEYSIIYVSSA